LLWCLGLLLVVGVVYGEFRIYQEVEFLKLEQVLLHGEVRVIKEQVRDLQEQRDMPQSFEIEKRDTSNWQMCGSGQANVSFAFLGEQPKTVFINDTRETGETFRYIDAENNQEKFLNKYRIWSDVVLNREKSVIGTNKAESGYTPKLLYQRIRASIYSPEGELWFDTTNPGEFFNITFYDFSQSKWFGLTATEGVKGDQENQKMKIGFDNPYYGTIEPKPIFALLHSKMEAVTYRLAPGPTDQGDLL